MYQTHANAEKKIIGPSTNPIKALPKELFPPLPPVLLFLLLYGLGFGDGLGEGLGLDLSRTPSVKGTYSTELC